MRRNGKDRDLSLLRSVTPEHSIRRRSLLLRVRLKDLLFVVVWIGERLEFMRIETGMSGILKQEIDALVKASLEDTWVFGRLPGTPHFKNVVARGIEEARGLKSRSVCTEHLLLGLLLEKGSVAHQALRKLGFSARKVREEIAKVTADQ